MKKLVPILIILLVALATLDAFILRPDMYYSDITRGKFFGILLVLIAIPLVFALVIFMRTSIKTRSIKQANAETKEFISNWIKVFTNTKKKKK